MNIAAQKRMGAQEFLAWADRQTEGRYEVIDGHVVAMAPERVAHTRAKAAAWLALSTALREAKLPCEAFADGVSVVIEPYKTREPDASVQCGPVADPNALALDRPLIVVEVLSPATEVVDRDLKVRDYFSVPTIRHYLIVDAQNGLLVHHRRSDAGGIEVSTHESGWIDLDPPGFKVAVGDLLGRQ
jgi:Uma2 family endonuclease